VQNVAYQHENNSPHHKDRVVLEQGVLSRLHVLVKAVVESVEELHMLLGGEGEALSLVQDVQEEEGECNCSGVEDVSKHNSELVTLGEVSVPAPVARLLEEVGILGVDQTSEEEVDVQLQEEEQIDGRKGAVEPQGVEDSSGNHVLVEKSADEEQENLDDVKPEDEQDG